MKKSNEENGFIKYSPDLFSHVKKFIRSIQQYPFKDSCKWSKLTNQQYFSMECIRISFDGRSSLSSTPGEYITDETAVKT